MLSQRANCIAQFDESKAVFPGWPTITIKGTGLPKTPYWKKFLFDLAGWARKGAKPLVREIVELHEVCKQVVEIAI